MLVLVLPLGRLTMYATIFIPLIFIAGIYGMNFEYIPELGYRYGCQVIWEVMIAIVVSLEKRNGFSFVFLWVPKRQYHEKFIA